MSVTRGLIIAGHQTGRLALDFYREHDVDLTAVVVGHTGTRFVARVAVDSASWPLRLGGLFAFALSFDEITPTGEHAHPRALAILVSLEPC